MLFISQEFSFVISKVIEFYFVLPFFIISLLHQYCRNVEISNFYLALIYTINEFMFQESRILFCYLMISNFINPSYSALYSYLLQSFIFLRCRFFAYYSYCNNNNLYMARCISISPEIFISF